jgi:methylmalonyl-CoA epimerase
MQNRQYETDAGGRMKIKRVEHIAIAVDSLEQSIDFLKDTFGLSLEYEERIGQTRLAMLPVGQTYIELLEGQGPESSVTKWIGEKGPGLFHICFEVEDIDGAMAELKRKGVKLRDETPRIGHAGARIAFLDPSFTGNVLIELAELACRPLTTRDVPIDRLAGAPSGVDESGLTTRGADPHADRQHHEEQ